MYTNTSPFRCAIIGLAVALLAATASAQEVQRLPGVVIRAGVTPGRTIIAGIVRDTAGFPLPGAEVLIAELQKRVFTNDSGTFQLAGVRDGTWHVRARKMGYAPVAKDIRIAKNGTFVEMELLPWAYSLPAIVVSTARGGLSGVVADTAYIGIPNAEVRVLATDFIAITDSSGRFFLPARPGTYMVHMKKGGYAERVASVTVPADSGRDMRAILYPAHDVPVREASNIADLHLRQVLRIARSEPFFTHEDMVTLGYTWVIDLVRWAGMDQFSEDCVAMVNGGPAVTNLSSLTVDDVDAVEIYDVARWGPDVRPTKTTVQAQASGGSVSVPVGNTLTPWKVGEAATNADRAKILNKGIKCATVYVWLR